MNINLTIGGTDLTEYVISTDRSESLRTPVGKLTLELSTEVPVTINSYDEVVLQENDTDAFTGYVKEVTMERIPPLLTVECGDPLIRAKDFWFADLQTSDGENTVHWIKHFLNMAGITDITTQVFTSSQVYPGYGWEKMNCLEAINTILEMTPYQLLVEGDGTVVIKEVTVSKPNHILEDDFIEWERTQSDSTVRNRAIIFGIGFTHEETESSNIIPGSQYWTVAAGNGVIYNVSTAEELAQDMLSHMNKALDVKNILVEGSPEYKLGQTFQLLESESGYSYRDILTSLNTRYNAEEGYVSELTLGEKFRNFWGWDREPESVGADILYAATWGHGVYKKGEGNVWASAGLSGKYVRKIAVWPGAETVIALCNDGVYLTNNSGSTWEELTMPEPLQADGSTVGDLIWYDLVRDWGGVLVLAGHDGKIWIYEGFLDMEGEVSEFSSWTGYRVN